MKRLSKLAISFFILSGSFNTLAVTPVDECKKLFDNASYKQAIPSCKLAAESGDKLSQTQLGEIYDRMGNSNKTAYWWGKAAGSGYQPARHLLALKHFYGGTVLGPEKGWEQNYNKAFHLWEEDAKKGIASSQFMIGVMYQNGFGVDKNLSEAWFWLNVSLENGYKLSTDVLIEISHDISTEEKNLGKNMLAKYIIGRIKYKNIRKNLYTQKEIVV